MRLFPITAEAFFKDVAKFIENFQTKRCETSVSTLKKFPSSCCFLSCLCVFVEDVFYLALKSSNKTSTTVLALERVRG